MHGIASQWLPVNCQGTFGSAVSGTVRHVKLLVARPNDNLRPNVAAESFSFCSPAISTAACTPAAHPADRGVGVPPVRPRRSGARAGDAELHRRHYADSQRVGPALGAQRVGALRQSLRSERYDPRTRRGLLDRFAGAATAAPARGDRVRVTDADEQPIAAADVRPT